MNLTDSLSCMVLLKSLQRRNFPLLLCQHPLLQLLLHTVLIINALRGGGRSNQIQLSQIAPRETAQRSC